MKYRMRKIAAACLFSFICSYTWSVPAKPGLIVYRQPDGTELRVRLMGDEFHHYYLSEDGRLLLSDSSKRLCYAYITPDGLVQPSAFQAQEADSRTDEEIELLASQSQTDVLQRFLNSSGKQGAMHRAATNKQRLSNPYPTTGKQKVLVILAEFSDQKFVTVDAKNAFNRMLNEKGYSENGATGSARDYYMDSSAGLYEPEIDVYGPVTLSNPMSYYGANTGKQDIRPWYMIADACSALDEEVDFSKYDLDNDGFVDNVYLFYAGYGEADGGPAESVWPHSSNLSMLINLRLDGVLVDRYACSNELVYETDKMVGIGTFCHEFGHVLGLPDVYSTDYSHNVHPGNWDIMSGGNYLNNGNTPPLMSAYERYYLNWLEPTELTQADTTVVLPPLAENKAYRISTDYEDEYFLLENRQQTGWDAFLPGHGMLVWHIDYFKQLWDANTPNDDATHQHIDIEEADNITSGDDRSGNTFPGKSNVTSITNSTTPNFKTWNNKESKFVLFNIHETADSLILFDAINPDAKFTKAVATEATDITPVSFVANWKAVEGATSYAIDVYSEISTVNGTMEVYADGYRARPVGNVLRCEVTGLQPETTYFYRVRARDSKYIGDYSDPVKLVSGDKDFRFFYPTTEEPTNITSGSFIANWNKLAESERYYVSVIGMTKGDEETLTCDFARGVKLPEGWTTNVFTDTSDEGYYGKASPALCISKNKGLIQSPVKKSPVGKMSFWYRGFDNLSEGSKINVYGYDANQSWKIIQTIHSITKAEGGEIFALDFGTLNEKYYATAIELNRPGSGAVSIDDIEVCHQTTVTVEMPQYTDVEVSEGYSLLVEGLEPATTYGYKVKGFNGEFYSKYSPVRYLKTMPGEVSIDATQPQSDLYAFVSEGILIVRGLTTDEVVCVYDISGRLLEQKTANGEELRLALPTEGIFLIQVGNQTLKAVR